MLNKTIFLFTSFFILMATELLRVYFIMLFPGSQASNTIQVVYFIDRYKWAAHHGN